MNTAKKMDAIVLLFDSNRGVYIPQHFAQHCIEGWHDVTDEKRKCLLAGPGAENEWYWETWQNVLDNAYFEKDGHKWQLLQDGDTWAYCLELMTDEEKDNFGFNED